MKGIVLISKASSGPLKGVNLGGWLISERWMTPSVYSGTEAVDEYTLSQTVAGKKAIKHHRDTFIQESDFIWLKKHRIDIVRLPIGHWVFENHNSLMAHSSYVDWVMKMADTYDIEVIIDVHALQGSQNGKDHSAKIGKAEWFTYKHLRNESLISIVEIAKRYADHPKLWGFQIINEPKLGVVHCKLRNFYKRAYTALESILQPHTRIIYSDGYTPRLLTGAMKKSRHPVTMDVHLYHFAKFWTHYVSLACYYTYLPYQKRLLARLAKKQPIIIGEWSGVFTQKMFNAYPTSQHGELIKDHVKRQLDSFQPAEAWFYWNYKAEHPGVWDFRSQVEAGIIKL